MRWLGALLIIVASTISVQAEDWTTADGKTYKNVVVIGQENDGVRVTWEGGVGKLPYYELDDNTLRKLGQDPAAQAIKRAAFVKSQAEAALQAKQDAAIAAEQKRKEAEAAALAAAQTGNPTAPQNPTTPANGAPGTNPAAPQNSTATTQTSGQPQMPGQPPGPGQPATPGQPQTTAPAPGQPAPGQSTASAPNGSPQPNFVPPKPAPTPAPAPASADTASRSFGATDEQQAEYPNSKFQYDDTADVSYLESNVVNIEAMSADAPVAGPGQSATLHFRITTEGQRAESPDEVEGFFYSAVPLKKLATDRKVKFLVDGAFIPTREPVDSSDADPDPLRTNQVSFFLSPEQTRAILSGKKVNVNVGGYDYRIDDPAMASLRGFMADITKLPPASTNYMKAFHRFVNRLPSIISVISSTCEYIILGAFGIVVVASIAAFVMGLTRFIKM
jgi:hypothetical protein